MSNGKLFAIGAASLGAATVVSFDECSGPDRPGTEPVPIVSQITENDLPDQPHFKLTESQFNPLPAESQLPNTVSATEIIVIKPGDSLSGIISSLQKKGVHTTLEELMSLNGISDPNRIQSGSTLRIPGAMPAYKSYFVRSGDTLSGITEAFRTQGHPVTLEEIARINGLIKPAYRILAGQELQIPIRIEASIPREPATQQQQNSSIGNHLLALYPLRADFIDHLKQSEGYRSTAYICVGNTCTIGWGHTRTAKPGMHIDTTRAEQLLEQDLHSAAALVAKHVTVPLTHSQYEALVDMAFNLGGQLFVNPRTGQDTNTKKAINAITLNAETFSKNPQEAMRVYQESLAVAISHIKLWVNAGGQVQEGLVIRRSRNAELFADSAEEYADAQKQILAAVRNETLVTDR